MTEGGDVNLDQIKRKTVAFQDPEQDGHGPNDSSSSLVGKNDENNSTHPNRTMLPRDNPTRKSVRDMANSIQHHATAAASAVTKSILLGACDKDVVGVREAGDHIDLRTGMTTTRYQTIHMVSKEDQQPMRATLRRRRGTHSSVTTKPDQAYMNSDNDQNNAPNAGSSANQTGSSPVEDTKRYRIISGTNSMKTSRLRKIIQQDEDFILASITGFFRWTFTATFMEVFFVSFLGFMVLIIIFALFVYWIDRHQPECVAGVDRENGAHNIDFVDAYHLSWTTLSTVGYGIVAPGLTSAVTDSKHSCRGINILMAFESFVGVLFASIIGATLFGKVARIQSIAPVKFSDPIVVRYDTGCDQPDPQDPADRSTLMDECMVDGEIPCPILEFRMINTIWNLKGGEIMDATVSLVVSRLANASKSVAKDKIKQQPKRRRKLRPLAFQNTTTSADSKSLSTVSLLGPTHSSLSQSGSVIQRLNRSLVASAILQSRLPESASPHAEEEAAYNIAKMAALSVLEPPSVIAVEEHVGSDELAPCSIFERLEVETDRHPFFRRLWTIRHVCNENSPLLPNRIRRKIQENNGYWPRELNSYDEVRRVLNFHEIIVSFSGTANASGSSVFAQKVYSYVDMVVGYSFANVLNKDKEGKLIVDEHLLNDVKEQIGGGAEPINTQDVPIFSGYAAPTDSMSPIISQLTLVDEDLPSSIMDDLEDT